MNNETLEKVIAEIDNKLVKDVIVDSNEYFLNILDKLEGCEKDKEYFLLNTLLDLTKAITKYLNTDDKISNYSINFHLNTFTFSAAIIRNDKDYFFNCDSILAGGYNIQKLHIRYIVNTNLPSNTNKDNDLLKIKNIISILNKREKLLNYLESTKNLIIKLENDILIKSNYSYDDIIQNNESGRMFAHLTWNDIVLRGADKNYDYSEENFNKRHKEMLDDILSTFKNRLEFDKKRVVELKKSILKTEKQLNEL